MSFASRLRERMASSKDPMQRDMAGRIGTHI